MKCWKNHCWKSRTKWFATGMAIGMMAILMTACNAKVVKVHSDSIYKADYIEACQMISEKYIYLEDKLHMDRKAFLEKSKQHADQVDWSSGKVAFIHELNQIKAQLPDGHLEWTLSEENQLMETDRYLGFTVSATEDGKFRVGRVFSYFTNRIKAGDVLLEWNGRPVEEEIKALGRLNPQSSEMATREKAARRLTLDYASSPLRESFEPVKVKVQHENGTVEELEMAWKNCKLAKQWREYKAYADDETIIMTRGKIASLEEIPATASYMTNDLPYYLIEEGHQKYAVLHPRSFYDWEQADLDKTMGEIIKASPDVLIVDLKDTAGGALDQVLYLSHALNVKKSFAFTYDVIDEKTNQRSQGTDNLDSIAKTITIKNVWKGKTIFRTNCITVSGGDFFARWMQLNKRGTFIGKPTAGAGGGTSDFELPRTQTVLSIPMRDRTLIGDSNNIEGHPVKPDVQWEGTLESYLQERLSMKP